MDYQKKSFCFGDLVVVVKTNSSMDGVFGRITGIASINWFDVYIVTMDEPMQVNTAVMPRFQSFTMPETCLELVRTLNV